MQRSLHVHRAGRVAYGEMLQTQIELRDARLRGEIPDTLIVVEHDPVITLGRSARDEHVLASPEDLRTRGIDVFEIGRGGDVTYHGPGQLVCYPVLDLKPDRKDVRKYVSNLEEVMIRLCERHGLSAKRVAGLNGAWVGARKIGAVGVRIRQWVTMHGFAFNVSTALDAFDVIVPCGIRDREVTSLERELGTEVEFERVTDEAVATFTEVFGHEVVDHVPIPELGRA